MNIVILITPVVSSFLFIMKNSPYLNNIRASNVMIYYCKYYGVNKHLVFIMCLYQNYFSEVDHQL